MEVNYNLWGDEASWVISYSGTHKVCNTLISQYDTTPSLEEFGQPLDTSPAFWGWNKNCSWATTHCRSVNNGIVQDVYNQPDVCDPVMGWDYKFDRNGEYAVYYEIDPRVRFCYDTVYDGGTSQSTYTESDARGAFGGAPASQPWMDMTWSGWCAVPEFSMIRITQADGFEIASSNINLTNIDSYLADGWIPCQINMSRMFAGDATGATQRSQINLYGYNSGIIPFLTGMTDVKLTPDLLDYYTQTVSTYVDKYFLPPDYGNDGKLGKYPFLPASTSFFMRPDERVTSRLEATWRGSQIIGGHNSSNITIYQDDMWAWFIKYSTDVQNFNDVSYHWECRVCDDDGQEPDFTQTSGNIHTYTYLVIDSINQEGLTEAQAYKRAILHECAFFGMKFAISGVLAQTADLTTSGTGIGLYLPLFTDAQHTTGEYKTGQDYVEDENADLDSARDMQFDPDSGDEPVPDPSEPGARDGDWSWNPVNATIDARNYHVIDIATYIAFMNWAKSSETIGDIVTSTLDYNGINASDWVLFVKEFPIPVPEQAPNPSVDILSVGGRQILDANDNPLSGKLLHYNTTDCTYNFGSIYIGENLFTGVAYRNFLSYTYGRLFLMLPFYGQFEIDLVKYWGADLKVEATVDFPNGIGTYYIYSNGVVFDSVDFAIGIDLPLSAYQMGNYQNTMHYYYRQRDKLDREQLYIALSTLGSGAMGNVMGVIGGVTNMYENIESRKDVDWNIQHTSPNAGKYLTASGFNACRQDLKVRLLRYQPKVTPDYNREQYGRQVGFACLKEGKLENFSGYMVCSNAKLDNIKATPEEKALILQQLKNGVYM